MNASTLAQTLLLCGALTGIATASRAETPAATQFERDRQAILAMTGEFEVKFHFEETVALKPGYELKPAKNSAGFEKVIVVEDSGRHIALQHLLVGDKGQVVKHWRQDWDYEKRDLREYAGGEIWQARHLTAQEAAGTWAQAVYEVTDGPRYESIGRWQHDGHYSAWQSAPTWRPLPRREYTTRKDYDVLLAVNRHVITPTGWVHEQDNTKWNRAATDGYPYLAREVGINDYRRIEGHDFAPAVTYWNQTSAYWSAVRAEWNAVLAGDQPLRVEGGAQEASGPLERVYDLAEATAPEADRIRDARELVRRTAVADKAASH
ncbi:MAG TPA: DUF6607 family protein [Candidatus Acidoferrum sp.]|nr:DUF6607 family protein [Candidatus Acidoferrum sp.]